MCGGRHHPGVALHYRAEHMLRLEQAQGRGVGGDRPGLEQNETPDLRFSNINNWSNDGLLPG